MTPLGTRRGLLVGCVLLASVVLGTAHQPAARAATATVTVTVNARAGLATMPDTALGVNDAVWDSQLGTNAVSDLLKTAGVRMMRYPGGSYGDIYHWKDNTAPGGYVAPNTDFDTFMGSVRRVGAQPMIIANYGTGTPEEAADWVRYANVTKGYGAKYWTIGNENLRQRPLRRQLGGRQPRGQEPDRLRQRRRRVRRRDEGGRPDDQDRRGADHAGQLAGRGWSAGGDAGHLEPDRARHRRLEDRLRRPALVPGRQHRRRVARPSRPRSTDALYLRPAARSRSTPARTPAGSGISLTETNVGVGPEHPARRAVPGRRLQRRCWRTACSRCTGGTCTTASARCPQWPVRPTTATSACSPAAPARPTARPASRR